MKANSCGTMTEQQRFRMGWRTSTENKAKPGPVRKCALCRFFASVSYDTKDGGCGISARCENVAGGFTTRETAGCDKWEGRL